VQTQHYNDTQIMFQPSCKSSGSQPTGVPSVCYSNHPAVMHPCCRTCQVHDSLCSTLLMCAIWYLKGGRTDPTLEQCNGSTTAPQPHQLPTALHHTQSLPAQSPWTNSDRTEGPIATCHYAGPLLASLPPLGAALTSRAHCTTATAPAVITRPLPVLQSH
jgi:hypothetical protein